MRRGLPATSRGDDRAARSRTYLGCRDQSPPRRDVGIHLAGGLTFAGSSTVWGGGIAFYDPHADGQVAARAYLLTFGQLSDVVAQEARRPVGSDLVLQRRRRPTMVGAVPRLRDRPAPGRPGRVADVHHHLPAGPRAHSAFGALPSHHARRARRSVRLVRGRAGALPVTNAWRHPGVDRQPTRRTVRRSAASSPHRRGVVDSCAFALLERSSARISGSPALNPSSASLAGLTPAWARRPSPASCQC